MTKMRFSGIIFAWTIGVLCIASSESLECWICSSLIDIKCSEDGFLQEKSNTILKEDCMSVNSPSPAGPIPRRINATTCLKNVVTTPGKTIVSRGCASPGDYGIGDATHDGCTTQKSANDGKMTSSQTCLCTGDYCNGAKIQTLATSLAIILPSSLCLFYTFTGGN